MPDLASQHNVESSVVGESSVSLPGGDRGTGTRETGVSPRVEAFEPIFIVGNPRSGTSTLAAMIDRHDQVAITPETHFFLTPPPRQLPRDSAHEALIRFYPSTMAMWYLHVSPDDVLARFRDDEPTPENYYRRALESFAAKHGKIRPGDKSVNHVYVIDKLVRAYPRAKFVCVIRDGRDSVQAVGRNRVFTSTRRRSSHFWRSGIQAYERAIRRHGDRIHTVRFEEMVRAPEACMRGVCEFLGLPFQPGMLDYTRPTASIPEKELSYKSKSMRPLDPSIIGEHDRMATDREKWLMDSVMAGRLRRLGYEPTNVCPCPLRLRLWDALVNLPYFILYDIRMARIRFALAYLLYRLRKRWSRVSPPPEPSESRRTEGNSAEIHRAGGLPG